MTILETERMRLRWLTEDDVPLLFAMDSDPEVMRYITLTPTADAEESRKWVRSLYARYYNAGSRYGLFAADEKATGAFIGWFALRPARDYRFAAEVAFQDDELELGYRFCRTFWGRGLATEGACALVEYGFADPAVRAIVAVALVENRASTRVMEKAGLKRVREYPLPGFTVPAVTYAVPRSLT
jgi:[ribosomal protein S5]-alanine N-acetyltransferase